MKNRNKLFGIIVFITIIGFMAIGCSETPAGENNGGDEEGKIIPPGPDATSLSILPTTRVLTLGETVKPTVTVAPSDAPIINWVSSDTNVATVSSDGTISSKSIGRTVVTVTAKGGIDRTCTVTVAPDIKTVAGFGYRFNVSSYGDGRFVAGGNNGIIAWSDDGINWTEVDSTLPDDLNTIIYAIAYGNGIFVAAARENIGNFNFRGRLIWSDDRGESWQRGTGIGDNTQFLSVVFGNNVFLAGGSGEQTVISQDGKTWKTAATGIFGDNHYSVSSLAYGNNKFIAARDVVAGMAYSSDNGSSWTIIGAEKRPFGNIDIIDIVFGNGKFVAISDSSNNNVAYSEDGENWTVLTAPFSVNRPRCIAYGNGIFIGGGNNRFEYSRDGISWATFGGSGNSGWVVIGGGKFVGLSGANLIYAPIVLE